MELRLADSLGASGATLAAEGSAIEAGVETTPPFPTESALG